MKLLATLAAAATRARGLRGALSCRLGFVLHDAVRVPLAGGGTGARCTRCKKTAATVMELLDPHREDVRARRTR